MSLNPVQKADDPIQDRNRSIGPMSNLPILMNNEKYNFLIPKAPKKLKEVTEVKL